MKSEIAFFPITQGSSYLLFCSGMLNDLLTAVPLANSSNVELGYFPAYVNCLSSIYFMLRLRRITPIRQHRNFYGHERAEGALISA